MKWRYFLQQPKSYLTFVEDLASRTHLYEPNGLLLQRRSLPNMYTIRHLCENWTEKTFVFNTMKYIDRITYLQAILMICSHSWPIMNRVLHNRQYDIVLYDPVSVSCHRCATQLVGLDYQMQYTMEHQKSKIQNNEIMFNLYYLIHNWKCITKMTKRFNPFVLRHICKLKLLNRYSSIFFSFLWHSL